MATEKKDKMEGKMDPGRDWWLVANLCVQRKLSPWTWYETMAFAFPGQILTQ